MDRPHDVRIVVQHLGFSPEYRVVVYGDDWKPTHADFENQQALLQAICDSLPDFDTSLLCLDQPHEIPGTVLFAGSIELDRSQAKLLKLI